MVSKLRWFGGRHALGMVLALALVACGDSGGDGGSTGAGEGEACGVVVPCADGLECIDGLCSIPVADDGDADATDEPGDVAEDVPEEPEDVPEVGPEEVDVPDDPEDVPPEIDEPDVPEVDEGCETAEDCLEELGELEACQIAVCDADSGECSVGNAEDGTGCDDDDPCTINDSCTEGVCGGLGGDCDDGDDCTDDLCTPLGCEHEPVVGGCDDGNFCTSDDQCTAEGCAGVPVVCDAAPEPECVDDVNLRVWDEVGSCDVNDGECTYEFSHIFCPDGCVDGACATPVCDGAAAGTECDDFNACTLADACDGEGKCVGTAIDCSTFADDCNTSTCDPDLGGCKTVALSDGTDCDDESVCTLGETCQEGVCTAAQTLDCDDGSPCTEDLCLALEGCQYADLDGPCDDGKACTLNDVCVDGACLGDAVGCDDDDPCTDDDCDPIDGSCTNVFNQAPCDDGDPCTQDDACNLGECAGPPLACEDGNPCTQKVCQAESGGCIVIGFVDNTVACYSGAEGTEGVGACAAGLRQCNQGVLGPCLGEVLPVTEICSNGIDDDCDVAEDEEDCEEPPEGLEGAKLHFSLDAQGPGLLTGGVTDAGDGAYTQAVTALTTRPPATIGVVTASAGTLSGSTVYATQPGAATWIRAITRTTDVWVDAEMVRGVVQVRDALGRPRVQDGTQITMRVTQDGGDGLEVTDTCLVTAKSICEPSVAIPEAWFELGQPTEAHIVYELPDGTATPPDLLVIHPVPVYGQPVDPSVYIQLPLSPKLPGETFVAEVWAMSSAQIVEAFDVAILYDPNSVTVDEVAFDPAYNGVNNPKFGELLLVAVRAAGVPDEDVTGLVHLADVTFRMNDDAEGGGLAAFGGIVEELIDVQSVDIVPEGSSTGVRDGIGAGDFGFVQIADNPLRDIYAVAESAELFNTAVLDGETVLSPIEVIAVKRFPPDEPLHEFASCESDATGTLDVHNDCVAAIDDDTTVGSPEVTVTVSLGDLETTVPFRVWYPLTPIDVSLEDNILQAVPGWLADNCVTQRYQRTDMHADVTFTLDGSQLVTTRLDHLLTFESTVGINNVSIEGNVVSGVQTGSFSVAAMGAKGPLGEASGAVTEELMAITSMTVLVPTGLEIASLAPPSPLLLDATTTVTANLLQKFDFEGVTGPVLAYVHFADGSRMEVTEEMGLEASSNDSAVVVSSDPLEVIAKGSGTGQLVDAVWDVCGDEVASGSALINAQLPLPVSAEGQLADPVLATGADAPAAIAGLPHETTVTVDLEFDDGQVKDFTLDPRTVFDDTTLDPLDFFNVVIDKDDDGNPVKARVVPTGIGFGPVALRVTFLHAPAIETIIPVDLVAADGFALDAHPWPAFPGSEDISKTTLALIEGTNVFQQAVLDVDLLLTDGSSIDISTHPEIGFDTLVVGTPVPELGVVTIDGPNVITPLAVGVVDVVATFGFATSDPLPIIVDDEGLWAVEVVADFVPTFSGVKDEAQETVSVDVTFNDGTVLSNAQDLPGFLEFSSSDPDRISVAELGVATLHDNHRLPVTLTASQPDAGVDGSVDTHANLSPALGDVDLGQLFGVPHPDVLPGETFEMPVRVNTADQPLGAIDLVLGYDPEVIAALSADPGVNWPGGQLEITLNDPPGEVHIVGATSVGTSAKGPAVEVATITFQGLKAEGKTITPITGELRKLIEGTPEQLPIGEGLGLGESRAIIAGAGDLDPDCPPDVNPYDIRGNADGDCEFSVADVSFAMHYIAELVTDDDILPIQAALMDVNEDGDVSVLDVVFMIRVLAGKYHFVDIVQTSAGGLTGVTGIDVHLQDAAGDPVDEQALVYLHIATVLNQDLTLVTGTLTDLDDDGLVVVAEPVGDGVYRVEATDFAELEVGVGIVIVLETQDGLGETADDRKVALYSSPWLSEGAAFEPFTYVDLGSGEEPKCLSDLACDDDNLCTDDVCDPGIGCFNIDNQSPCDDDDACTEADFCSGGVCAGIDIPGCGEAFCGNGTCDEGEDCTSCAFDCGICPEVCGNGTCAEDCGACAGDCCQAHGGLGCDDPIATACVCALDSWCCTNDWDASCATKADEECGACPGCGDGTCGPGEDCGICPADCACTCGDGLCTAPDEDCETCVDDCGACFTFCGDDTCDDDESCSFCPEDCGECPPECGDFECNGDESCLTCEQDCGECPPICGDDTCDEGENCLTCKADCGTCEGDCCDYNASPGCEFNALNNCVCQDEHFYCCVTEWDIGCVIKAIDQCDADTLCPQCGDGVCNGPETCIDCEQDCGECEPECGDGFCQGLAGEFCDTCPQDCGECSTESCCTISGQAGCDDAAMMECVCEDLPHTNCCSLEWNDFCIYTAATHCGLVCEAICGDGICLGEENCVDCEQDCGECAFQCGDDLCDGANGEDCVTCEADCGGCPPPCGDGICEGVENCELCADDCGPCTANCGDGLCEADEHCVSCPSDCPCDSCGDGLCIEEIGETTTTCPLDCEGTCGDGTCAGSENCLLCEQDCGACLPAVCGDGVCAPTSSGEGCSGCPTDCTSCTNVCDLGYQSCGGVCDPSAGFLSGCTGNLACVPSTDADTLFGTAFVLGNGVCGTACNPGIPCPGGQTCLDLDGLDIGYGICGVTCTPGVGAECGVGELCVAQGANPSEGACVPSPSTCDPSSPVASGCPVGPSLGCIHVAGTPLTNGVCLSQCFQQDPAACSGGAAGACLAYGDPAFSLGTCAGNLAGGCDVTDPDGCDPGANDRCSLIAGSAYGGFAFYCEGAGAGGDGAACAADADCSTSLLCFEGTCRRACDPAAGSCPAGVCTDVSAGYYTTPNAVGVCLDQ